MGCLLIGSVFFIFLRILSLCISQPVTSFIFIVCEQRCLVVTFNVLDFSYHLQGCGCTCCRYDWFSQSYFRYMNDISSHGYRAEEKMGRFPWLYYGVFIVYKKWNICLFIKEVGIGDCRSWKHHSLGWECYSEKASLRKAWCLNFTSKGEDTIGPGWFRLYMSTEMKVWRLH